MCCARSAVAKNKLVSLKVSLDIEVLEVSSSSLETRFSCRGLRAATGSGDVRLPEELEPLGSTESPISVFATA